MNQKGMSLIEVVVSLTIMSIVVVMVFRFVQVGLNTSSSTTKTANIQKEAQTTVNQLKDWIMETNKGIVCYGPGVNYDQVVALYNDGETAKERYVQLIFYRAAEQALYYEKVAVTGSEFCGTEREIAALAEQISLTGTWKEYLFSQYISSFSLERSSRKSKQVTLSITYENQGKSYETSNIIMMRNEPQENPAEYSWEENP